MSLLRTVDEGRPSDGVGHISWADNNSTAFARLVDLYLRPGMTVADPTFGKGVFWKEVDVGQFDLLATDLATDGVDARALPYEDESLDALVFDPPYRYVERRTVAGHTDEQYRLSESLRFEQRPGVDGVLDLYERGIAEAARVVKLGGFVFIKCQDTAGDGKQYWIHLSVMEFCEKAGLTPVDLMVVVTASPPPTRWKVQRSLRKAHSYFVVARKGGFYPFGYKSVQRRGAVEGDGE